MVTVLMVKEQLLNTMPMELRFGFDRRNQKRKKTLVYRQMTMLWHVKG